MSAHQRWLTPDAMCSLLGISQTVLRDWVKKKWIVRIGSGNVIRYLDPGPEYADQLRLGHELFTRANPEVKDLSMVNLLTSLEIAQIMGWDAERARKYLHRHRTLGLRTRRHGGLYRVQAVRDIVWRYNGRKKATRRTPFLLQEIIDFFLRYQATQDAVMPTDAQFEQDDMMMKKLKVMMDMPSPDKERAVSEFMAKMALAKKSVSLAVSASQRDPHNS